MKLYQIKYITLKKLINLFKVYWGYVLSIITKRAIVTGYPFSLTTEPTNICNLQCLECATGNKSSNRQTGLQTLTDYKRIIDQVKDFVIYHMIYFQGEPFLNPNFFEMIRYADQNNIFTATSTNGHFLYQENCDKIIKSGLKKITVSLDGVNQESYVKYRVGGNFEQVLNGIKTLIKRKKELNSRFPLVYIQFLVFKHNQNEIKEIKKLAKQIEVDKVILKSAQIEDFEKNSNLIPNLYNFSRYDTQNLYKIKTIWPNKCFRIWSILVITWEGTIIPCCFDKRLNFQIGNAGNINLKEAWRSKKFNDFRTENLKYRKKTAICRNCSEGLRIKY